MAQALGMVGIGLSVVAYLPQVSHLAKRALLGRDQSPRAWAMWLASSPLVGALAVYRRDYVLINLAASSLLSSTAILLARRYRSMACGTHRHPILQPLPR